KLGPVDCSQECMFNPLHFTRFRLRFYKYLSNISSSYSLWVVLGLYRPNISNTLFIYLETNISAERLYLLIYLGCSLTIVMLQHVSEHTIGCYVVACFRMIE